MRSGLTAAAVLFVAMSATSALVGCGGSYDSKTYAAQTPAGGYAQTGGTSLQSVPASASARTATASSDDREEEVRQAEAPEPQPALSSPPPMSPPPPQEQPQAAAPPPAASRPERAEPTKEPAQTRDLVIYTARFTMAVYQVDQGLAAVEKIARDNGGFLGQKRDREITVRVPRGRFETTLAAIDKVGDVLHREIQAQDVTDEHVDLEIRIKNARAMQRRLTDLLAKANVKDALEIEKELHRVTQELELLEGRMKVLKDKIALSTITVVFEPRGAAIQTARARLPFPWLGALNLPSLLSLSEEK